MSLAADYHNVSAGTHRIAGYSASHSGDGCGKNFDNAYRHGAKQFYWRHFEKPLLAHLLARLAQDKRGRYLDFACGTGRILEVAASYFDRCTGIDVSADMLNEARLKVPQAELICATSPIDLNPGAHFSVVTLFRFLLNADNYLRQQVLDWLRSVICDDGVLVLNNHRSAGSVRGFACRVRNRTRSRKRNTMSAVELEELLQQSRFRVVERYGVQYLPSLHNRLLAPAGIVLRGERLLGRLRIDSFAENQIYVCEPF